MISRDTALNIVTSHIQNKNLVKHCLAVEAAMKGLAKYFNEDEELWGLAGLLHDADWEECRTNIEEHTHKTVGWIKEAGGDEKIIKAILSHNYAHNGHNPPNNNMEWALYTCDELTGLIVATALVRPEKKLSSVTPESVMKKMNAKAFAAAIDRDQIKMCEEKLGIKLEDFIEIILKSMQDISSSLGL
ncbi:MAG: HDIG domain-containing protein [bacterium]|nr:HDIG domain-containing protein [bacterium]